MLWDCRRSTCTWGGSENLLISLAAQWFCLNDSSSLYFPTGNTINPLKQWFSYSLPQEFIQAEHINRFKKSLDKLKEGRPIDLCFWREREVKRCELPLPLTLSFRVALSFGPVLRLARLNFLNVGITDIQWGHWFYIYLGQFQSETHLCE